MSGADQSELKDYVFKTLGNFSSHVSFNDIVISAIDFYAAAWRSFTLQEQSNAKDVVDLRRKHPMGGGAYFVLLNFYYAINNNDQIIDLINEIKSDISIFTQIEYAKKIMDILQDIGAIEQAGIFLSKCNLVTRNKIMADLDDRSVDINTYIFLNECIGKTISPDEVWRYPEVLNYIADLSDDLQKTVTPRRGVTF